MPERLQWSKADVANQRLLPCLHQTVDGNGARNQGSNLSGVELAVKTQAERTAGLPPDHRRAAKRSAVQDHRRPGWKSCRAMQLRATGRQVEKMDGMTLYVRL